MNTNQPNLNAAIDACRPGSEDLSLPQMRELSDRIEQDAETRRVYERCQRLDAVIADVVRDVDVPVDLCAKLLARASETKSTDVGVTDVVKESAAPVSRKPSRVRSKWFAVGGTIAACLVVAVVGASILLPNPSVSLDELQAEVRIWVDHVHQNPWNTDMESAPEHGLGRFVVVGASGWQVLGTAYDPRAVVYDLRDNSGSNLASLIVIQSRHKFDVDQAMPAAPLSTTGGYAVGACQKGDLLFVLVVEGGKQRYQQYVRPTPPVM